MTTTELVPVRYRVAGGPLSTHDAAYIEERGQRDGSVRWVVVSGFGDVLNTAGLFEWEPQPSSRDDDFIARTRFLTVQDAHAAFRATLDPAAEARHAE